MAKGKGKKGRRNLDISDDEIEEEASSKANASTEEALWHRSGRRGEEHSLIDMDKSLLGKNPFAWLGNFFSAMAEGLKRIFEWVAKAIVAVVKFIVTLWHLISFFFYSLQIV